MKKLKKIKKKYLIIFSTILIIIILLILGLSNKLIKNIFNKNNQEQKEELKEISWDTKSVNGDTGQVLIKFYKEEGINKIIYYDDNLEQHTVNNEINNNTNENDISENGTHIISANGKNTVAIDYQMIDRKSYNFKVEYTTGETKNLKIDYEIPRIKGKYVLSNGIYVNEPDITEGFVTSRTRYMYLNEQGHLVPGNWITDEAPENWYDYSNQKWANIYVEDHGVDSYYVWIPRYAYKLDSSNQRSDVIFINTYNEYINPETGEVTEWNELASQGYQIPEAFTFGAKIIPGYWMSKYQLSELGSNYIIDYYLSATDENLNVNYIKTNTEKTIAKYTYAINGKIVNESQTAANYSFDNVGTDVKVINVTCLDEYGRIIGSMTKELEITEVNKPDISKFDQNTTFYVYWDKDGNEHNEVPISEEPPEGWYNYSYSKWANIVTRNNGVETYLVWIPRYQYKLNTVSQRSDIKFILGTGTETTEGYQIPEAFTFGGVELTGYWMSKYQLSIEESTSRLKADMAAGDTYINIREILGSLITKANTEGTNLRIEYYLNGELKHTGISTTEYYKYTGLNLDTEYTVNIIIRNADTNAYIGAITNKVTTKVANEPDISAFNPETTYYVVYDSEGNETRVPITEEKPENWYNYSNSRWANIVTTANGSETYLVWIPRYEYRILSDRDNLTKADRRTEVKFLTGQSTETSPEYKIPEAFTFAGKELTGYWMSKYQLSN